MKVFINPNIIRKYELPKIPYDIIESNYVPEDHVYLIEEVKNKFIQRQEFRFATYDWESRLFKCPFDFIKEFDKWFIWQERIHFNKEENWLVTGEMTNWCPEVLKTAKGKSPLYGIFNKMDQFKLLNTPEPLINF